VGGGQLSTTVWRFRRVPTSCCIATLNLPGWRTVVVSARQVMASLAAIPTPAARRSPVSRSRAEGGLLRAAPASRRG